MRCFSLLTAAAILFGLSAGSAGAQFRSGFGSPEALVESWYNNYLRRNPDPHGFRDHVWGLRRGTIPYLVEAEILGSPEYYSINGGHPEGFVQGLFRDVLGRPPSPGEFDHWMRETHQRGLSRTSRRFLEAYREGQPPPRHWGR